MKVITIGRSSQNDVPINDGKVSRHHCQIIQHDDGSYSLSDFGSTNGTFVNGRQVHGEVRLNPTDVVRIGNTVLNWKNYFKREVQNKPNVSISHDHTYTPISNSTTSGSKSSALPIALILVGSIVVLILLIFAIIHKFEKIDNKPNPDPWHYENGVRTNVPSGENVTTAEQTIPIMENEIESHNSNSILDISGDWFWESESGDYSFYLHLYENNGLIIGTYETYLSDGREDASDGNIIKENKTIKAEEEDAIIVDFYSGALGGKGWAVIKKISESSIIFDGEKGEGKAYVPMRTVELTKMGL